MSINRYGGWSFGGRKVSAFQEQKLNKIKSKPLAKVRVACLRMYYLFSLQTSLQLVNNKWLYEILAFKNWEKNSLTSIVHFSFHNYINIPLCSEKKRVEWYSFCCFLLNLFQSLSELTFKFFFRYFKFLYLFVFYKNLMSELKNVHWTSQKLIVTDACFVSEINIFLHYISFLIFFPSYP